MRTFAIVMTMFALLVAPAASSAQTTTSPSAKPINLHMTSRGHMVRVLQRRLIKLGYLRTTADGYFGVQTQTAVWNAQGVTGQTRDGVVGPNTWRAIMSAKAIIRPLAASDQKSIQADLSEGTVRLVWHNKVVRIMHTSTGKPGHETVTGKWTISRRERMSYSNPYDTWMPYAQYFYAGYAFHENGSVPAYPASHGCLRLTHEDALYLWNWATYGTQVIVQK